MDETETEQLEETELYVTELKDHVIIQQDGEHIYQEENVLSIPADEGMEQEEEGHHLVVDGQVRL